MKIHIARLGATDSADYRTIRLESLKKFPANYGSTYEEESVHSKLDFEKHIENGDSGKFIMGAFEDKKLIGICGFSRESQEKRRHRGTIIQMYIKNEYHGRGLGSALLHATVEEAFKNTGIEQLLLSVLADNKKAISIYEREGFIEYGFLKNYFKSRDVYADQKFMVLYRNEKK